MGLGEIGAGIRDIMAASDLPVLVDCDNGYGDVKTVVYTINAYERLGAQAVFFEDQISPKRCGHIHGKRLLSTEQMEANIRAAAENRINPETFIIARTDAREVFQSAFLFSFALLVAPFVLIPHRAIAFDFANTAADWPEQSLRSCGESGPDPVGHFRFRANSSLRSCLLPRRHGKYSGPKASPIPCGSPEEYVRIESAVRLGFLNSGLTLRRLSSKRPLCA